MKVFNSAGARASLSTCFVAACGILLLGMARLESHQGKDKVLNIGSSGSMTQSTSNVKEDDALETLRSFIKDETGMENKIVNEKDWQAVVDKLVKKELQIGVLQGYEFAWALEKEPSLKPLMLTVKSKAHRYPAAYVVANKDNKATDFGGLEGQSLSIPSTSKGFPMLFVEREALAKGRKLEAFFSKIVTPEEPEDAIDDVVDGVVQAAVVDVVVLDAFKRRKPGRFAKLKSVAQSQPVPPPVILYKDKDLDNATLEKFRDGLIKASTKERGQKMLTMFRLIGFENVPDDFAKVVAETRKKYPAEPPAK
jgi:ABC-type phosphate/phosphonate transport system substrate-binding protein